MSMTAFELMAKLSLDKSNYDKGLTDAEDQGNNAGSKIGNALGNAAKVGMGLVTAATGAAAIALGRLATQAVSSYAQYEQLVGGVEKLYQDASQKVVDYADKAYMTSGMSANNYLEIATSFSAALINSLGGDMDKAADMTDLAMRSISDNVNVFGSDITSVQMAFQGFAKQNYTMLDNLKLGYGGTKAEMERLIKDANEYGATIGEVTNLSIDSFADIVKAIDLIQQKQGIAGTTAKEAMHTIEGAARATQAAWKNVITAIAGGGDLQKAFDGLITSIFGDGSEGSGLLANIIPRLQKTMDGIGQFVAKASPYIEKYLPSLFEAILPPLLDSAANLMVSLAKSLPTLIGVILDAIPRIMITIADAIKKQAPIIGSALEVVATAVKGLFGFIADNGEAIITVLSGIVAGFAAFKTIMFIQELIPIISGIVTTVTSAVAVMELMGAASAGLTGALGILTGAVEILGNALTAGPQVIITAIAAAVAVLAIAIYHIATEEEAIKSLDEATKNHEQTIKDLTSAQDSWINATKSAKEASEQLAQAQEETGLSGEELYKQFLANKDAYNQMSPEQQRVLELYIQMKEKQDQLKESTDKLNQAQREETVASLQAQASAIKENGGSWDEYRQNVINAFNDQKIGQDEATQLFADAMTEMSLQSRVAFVEQIPANMTDGLLQATNEQETTMQKWSNEWETIKTFISDTWTAIKDGISQKWTDIQNALANIPDWFRDKFQNAWDHITGIFSAIGQWFSDRWNDIVSVFSGVADWFRDAFQSAKDAVTGVWDSIGNFFSDVWQWIKDALNIDEALTWGSDLIDNFTSGIENGFKTVRDTVSRLAQIIKDFIGFSEPDEGPLSNFHTFAPDMIDLFVQGLEEGEPKIQDGVAVLSENIKHQFDGMMLDAFMVGGNYITSLINGLVAELPKLSSITDSVKGEFDKIKDAIVETTKAVHNLINKLEEYRRAQAASSSVLDAVRGNNNAITSVQSMGRVVTTSVNSTGIARASNSTVNYNFNQVNNSPKALSTIEIYRQTRNQFSQLIATKGVKV